ncbi:acyl carrier protein [Candidatus Symbiopectobacterium sp. 'North America']|uniref:acyl carrier protein n=1 Tax=Candidatus Symbiopectobacterium sp. 'North America' TaxID=2794574 RepID=UPI0018CB76A8|nr:acyl carrier protein [Candidatus Symbiopectobacterium sp. 'North America']MBG6245348.1 acyl carrier protein [Candidatus Symbiopectobacterium sp. 'North America']
MSNFEKYKSAFVTTFDIENENGIEELKYQSIEAWDSVGHMGLIAALEDDFGIMLDTDDIVDLSSFQKGIEILKKYNVEI